MTDSQRQGFDVPPFARECMRAAGDAWGASFAHPFVRALADGTLEPERFRFYQMQDARYLEAFADACALISTRCTEPADKLWFLDAARLALVVEGELHAGYGERLGYGPADIAALELTPNNRAYQDHMVSHRAAGDAGGGGGGDRALPMALRGAGAAPGARARLDPDEHPYAEWLRTYANPEFDEYMQNLLERLQRFADAHDGAARDRARDAFLASARYEWMFWQQAWEGQQWPPA
jgi:thiaminase (transcriptional activator TenA)